MRKAAIALLAFAMVAAPMLAAGEPMLALWHAHTLAVTLTLPGLSIQ